MRPIISQMPPPRWVPTSLSVGNFSKMPRTISRANAKALSIGRPTLEAQPIVLHAFLAEADRGRVDHHRHVELGRQLEERQRVVVIRIAALEARRDPCALEPILLHCALEFAQEFVAAIGN